MASSDAHLNFPLLKLVSDARLTYGLRHQDFGRYRSHCVAKVHYLRKSVGLAQTAGKSRKYQRKDVVADKVASDKHLQIVLFNAERCWAYSQQLKESLDDPATPPTTRHLLIKRLGKAVSLSKDLVALAQSPELSSPLSASHAAQIHAYHLVMDGSLAFERGKHDVGLKSLSIAFEVLGKLASTAASATDEALANEMMDEVEPMLRFCAYKLGKDTAAGVAPIAKGVAEQEMATAVPEWDELSQRLAEEGKQGEKESVEITWRGETIPVRNAELVAAAVKVRDALATLKQDQATARKAEVAQGKQKEGKKEILGTKRMGTYDKALLVLGEAEAIASQLVEDNKIARSKGNTARFEASSRPLTLFHTYVQYHLLSIRIKRDLLVVSSASSKLAAREAKIRHVEQTYVARTETRNPAVADGKIRRLRAKAYPGLVKVFDTILLSLEAMRDKEVVEQDDELASTVEARIAFVRAQRCMYLSRGYALASSFPSSLSLNARAKLYARQSRSTVQSLSSAFDTPDDGGERDHDFIADQLPLDDASFDALDRELEADYDRISKEWFEATGGKVGENADEEDDVAAGVRDLSLADGKKEKKKAKVPFYDVAFNYVTAFDLDAMAIKAGLVAAPADAPATTAPAHAQVTEEAKAAVGTKEEEEPQPAKRGWGFGLFGRR
ncbi:hypothetical protein NBRC10512_004559 [Rhodotorula toruloides]|uniref:Signal recognition particle subunit SRP68 n=2 Tax=Rhodotorula toruloides TaxID=5286 RepID=A0A061B580_RHOTO|nr:signal recognition particle subunit SRP68 [Rhodotorula toruloides NP11]EMS18983.1 signal recognition particle subunit SRP68 [Rhodotorula toruloides NP11]CDR44979.1 RHTO0S10e03840g1_1 [Rhodotorula toruloides]